MCALGQDLEQIHDDPVSPCKVLVLIWPQGDHERPEGRRERLVEAVSDDCGRLCPIGASPI
jgi:hypothetical protein